jgi:hypothetical protein
MYEYWDMFKLRLFKIRRGSMPSTGTMSSATLGALLELSSGAVAANQVFLLKANVRNHGLDRYSEYLASAGGLRSPP